MGKGDTLSLLVPVQGESYRVREQKVIYAERAPLNDMHQFVAMHAGGGMGGIDKIRVPPRDARDRHRRRRVELRES